jgi:NADPH:quinone reductase-like Zn-dependent oxidoreductase
MMKAVRVHRFGGPEVLTLEHNVPIPEIRDNQVSVTVDDVALLYLPSVRGERY